MLQYVLSSVSYSAITVTKPVSFKGFCIDFKSTAGAYVVLPSKSGNSDCICPIILFRRDDSFYTLHNCACGSDTIFQDSFVVYQTNFTFVHVCFHNLTSEMNSTVIHFFEAYRECLRDGSGIFHTHRPYRSYLRSLKISIGNNYYYCYSD